MTCAHANRILALWTTGHLGQQRVVARERMIAISERPRGWVVAGLVFTDNADGHVRLDPLMMSLA